jgi:hypothetical protein
LANGPDPLISMRGQSPNLSLVWTNLGRSSAQNVELFYTEQMSDLPNSHCVYSPPLQWTLADEKRAHSGILNNMRIAFAK